MSSPTKSKLDPNHADANGIHIDETSSAASTADHLAEEIAALAISQPPTIEEKKSVETGIDPSRSENVEEEGKRESGSTAAEPPTSSHLHLHPSHEQSSLPLLPLPEFSLKAIAGLIKSGKVKNIIVLTGAGISVSAGIPDFRSKGTGLYDNLQKYNLPSPQAIFTLSYFRSNPHPFFLLAKELYPTHFSPTPTHHFITLLHKKGYLRRVYTQNIDGLELLADLPEEKLVQAHGGFSQSHCIDCNNIIPAEKTREDIFANRIPKCQICGGLVKPKIVFFGESLPARFHSLLTTDFPACDLLITMGTSLKVQPFASLIDYVKADTPRLLINNEKVGLKTDIEDSVNVKMLLAQLESCKGNLKLTAMLTGMLNQLRAEEEEGGFEFHLPSNKRDVYHESTCDEGVWELSRLLGWEKDLRERVENGYKGKKQEEEKVKTEVAASIVKDIIVKAEDEGERREKNKNHEKPSESAKL